MKKIYKTPDTTLLSCNVKGIIAVSPNATTESANEYTGGAANDDNGDGLVKGETDRDWNVWGN